VVDDNADMRDYLHRLLGGRYRVEAVADGEAALAAIDARMPDLVLTDIMMPRLDGMGLLARLRADPRTKTLPVIFLSARAGEESRIEGLHAGADDYLIKPFSARELVARIGSAIQLARVRQQAEETQRLLVGELNHRVKNTLASVQAIVQQTLRSAKNPTDFTASFIGRVQSMAKIHSLLSNTAWKEADLRDVIRDQLEFGPVDESRLTASGPPVSLGPQTAQHLALMLHELGTNSSKYGALSTPHGWVSIGWTVEDTMLRLRWVEQGGPPVRAPIRRGFGTTLIEQSAHGEGGCARMSIETSGIVWEIEFPLPNLDAFAAPAIGTSLELIDSTRKESAPERADQKPLVLAGRRLLVIEDEPLVALDLVSGLEEAGAEVMGSAGTTDEALQLIESASVDAVLLDANLRGCPVDDLAAALTRKKVPFVFVTGYGQESLPRSFSTAPMLAKPFSREQLLGALAPLIEPPAATLRLRPRTSKS
jgi:two-component sensor histidine kinase